MVPWRSTPPAARALWVFWAVVLGLGITGAGVLQALGPPVRQAIVPTVPAPAPVAAWSGQIAPPEPALLEASRAFPPAMLPRIGADGRMARQAYARPVLGAPADSQPRIAIILAGLGLSDAASRKAIADLPGAVTLAFSAYSPDAAALQALAREGGHEMLASLPMEPDSAFDSAGERALSTGLTPAENQRHLEWVLGRTQGYAGLTGASDGLRGERFASLSTAMAPVLDQVARRGLYYLDTRRTELLPGDPVLAVPHARADVVLDDPPGRADLDAKLLALERLARERGSAVAVALQIRPATVDRLATWAAGAEARGLMLVPLSALVVSPSK